MEINKDHTHPVYHLVEECAEFIQAAMKYTHFGKVSEQNGIVYNNLKDMEKEAADIEYQLQRFKVLLMREKLRK